MVHLKVITDKPSLEAILNFGKLQVGSVPFSVDPPPPQNTYDPAQSSAPSSCSLPTSLHCSSSARPSTSTVPVLVPAQTAGTNVKQLMPKSQPQPVGTPFVLQPAPSASNVLAVVLNQKTAPPQNQPSLVQLADALNAYQMSGMTVPFSTPQLPLLLNQNFSYAQPGLAWSSKRETSNHTAVNKQNLGSNQILFVRTTGTTAGPSHCAPQQQTPRHVPSLAHHPLQDQHPLLNQKLTQHHQPLPVHKQTPDHQPLPVHKQTEDWDSLPVRKLKTDKHILLGNTSFKQLVMQDPKQTEVPQPRQENHLFWDHKQTPGNQSWQQQKQSPNPEPLQGNEPMRVLTSIPLKHMLLLVPKQSQDEPPSLEVQPSAVPKQSQDDPPSLEVQPSAVPKQSQDDLPSLEVQPSAVPKQSQDDPPSLEVEPLADQKQLPDRKPLLAHQMSPVLSETTDIQPLPDSKQTPQHQPLQDKPSPDISPCSSSEKPHQPSVVVKAVADSACDSSVQQVTPRHQEPAENEPTSTVSEDPEPSETPSTPEVLDSDTEEPSSSNCQDFKLSLWQPRVSLDRLPLALPKPGGPLPSFLLVPGDAEDEFYLEELSEDSESHDDDITDDDSKPLSHDDDIKDDDSKPQSHNDDITDDESKPLSHDDDVTDDDVTDDDVTDDDVTDDDVTDDDSKPQSHDDDFTVCYTEPLSSPDSPPTLQTVSCSACGSANGSIICSACGRGYHRDCHVPTVGCDIWMEWTCSLCQDLSDPSDPHSWDRPQRAENLSLQDQKRCESLLLYLKVEGCSLLSKMDWVWSRLKTMSERLTRRRHPEYEASAELIYDVWRLLQDAARVRTTATSKDDDSVNTLMENFKNKVTEAFSSDLNSPRRRAHTQHAVMSQTEQVSEGSEVIEVVDDECELKNARKRLGDFSDLNEVKKRKTDNMTLPPSRSKQTPPSGFIS